MLISVAQRIVLGSTPLDDGKMLSVRHKQVMLLLGDNSEHWLLPSKKGPPWALGETGQMGFPLQAVYLTSAIRTSPTVISGVPVLDSSTLFRNQAAANSLESNACSAVSNTLIAIRTLSPPPTK